MNPILQLQQLNQKVYKSKLLKTLYKSRGGKGPNWQPVARFNRSKSAKTLLKSISQSMSAATKACERHTHKEISTEGESKMRLLRVCWFLELRLSWKSWLTLWPRKQDLNKKKKRKTKNKRFKLCPKCQKQTLNMIAGALYTYHKRSSQTHTLREKTVNFVQARSQCLERRNSFLKRFSFNT